MNFHFILNPVSGKHTTDIDALCASIKTHFPTAVIQLTRAAGHATELARRAAAQNAEAVVAIGGDGTINETARGLVGTQTALGVIPRGSGNGFARELGMPLDFNQALSALAHANIQPCDAGTANNELFLNVCGVGIEAEIAWQFMQHGKTGARGKWPYFKIGAKTVFTYQPPTFDLEIDGTHTQAAPLTLVFANGRQYGSNFKIAPQADFSDGLLDMVSVRNAPKWEMALALPGFFTDTWRPFGITHTTQVKHVIISREGSFPYHIDGEPRQAQNTLEITVKPHALQVLFAEGK